PELDSQTFAWLIGAPVSSSVTVPVMSPPTLSSRIVGSVTDCPAASVTVRALPNWPTPLRPGPTHWCPCTPSRAHTNVLYFPGTMRFRVTVPVSSVQTDLLLPSKYALVTSTSSTQASATGVPVCRSMTVVVTEAAGVNGKT